MKIVTTAQSYQLVDGQIEFIYTKVLLIENGQYYTATSSERRVSDTTELHKITHIPPDLYQPPVLASYTICTDTTSCYIKKPNLMAFSPGIDFANVITGELETCEIIRKQPHENIATYLGCIAVHGHVEGLCFEKYPETLQSRVNPGSLNKPTLVHSKERAAARAEAARFLPGIEAGIRHLHTLGIVHNDINPSNVAITTDGTPVIIDFDSSCAIGTALDTTKRTHGWFDPDVKIAQEENDICALKELEIWLTESSADKFQFKE